MPSPSTPRRSSKGTPTQSTPSRGATIAAAAALKNNTPASVKDRIRQWQEQGGGFTAPSSPSLDAQMFPPSPKMTTIEQPEPRVTPKPSPKKPSPQTSHEKTPKRNTTRTYVDPNTREWIREKPRSTSTPRKRIVSDDNWTKRYGSSREAKSVPGTPQPDAAARTPPRQASGRAERRATRRRTREETLRQSRDDAPIENLDDDSVRVLGGTPVSTYQTMDDDEIVVEIESSLPDSGRISPPVVFPKQSAGSKTRYSKTPRTSTGTPGDADDSRGRRKSSYAEALEAPPDSIAGSSTKFGSFKSRARQLFSKADAPPIPVPRAPTIEAWLDETSDPFVDKDEESVDVPAPLKTGSRRRTISEEADTMGQVQTSPSHEELAGFPGKRESERRRRRRTRPSLDKENQEPLTPNPDKYNDEYRPIKRDIDEGHDASNEMSPSTLRRRGAARGQRSKSRGRSINTSERLQDLGSSPTPGRRTSPSATEDRPSPLKDRVAAARPSAPMAKHQLSTVPSEETMRGGLDPNPSEDMLARGSNELRRRLTTNDDLMSVLSMPRTGSRKIRSARTVRSRRYQTPGQDVGHILQELQDDENRYMRELNTLVDGVIPVLLQCILSKSDMTSATGLFGGVTDNTAITKPVMDMGIALERLKSLHRRIPLRDTESLYSWAQGAHKVYQGYIGSWRMGFQDVIINLAPAQDEKDAESRSEGGMARDAEGDVIDSDGKKVDVANLLKRPLVRLKHLSKTFQRLNEANPTPRAENVFHDYQDLVDLARRRSNEERGRLEDEAAAGIDPTKARDTRSLAILSGVTIDKTRTVKARDYFNLTLHHSSGQRIDCRVELVLRDNKHHFQPGGDLLLCEVDDQNRWLLFPPLMNDCLSARIGDVPGEIIVMIRGTSTNSYEWHELLSLHNDDESTCYEWVQMIGSDPMPPKLFRSQSFINRQKETTRGINRGRQSSELNRTPSPSDIDVPIGEPSVLGVNERHQGSPRPMRFDARSTPDLSHDPRNRERSISPQRSSIINRKPLPTQASPHDAGMSQSKRHSLQPVPSSPILKTGASKRLSLYGESPIENTYGSPGIPRHHSEVTNDSSSPWSRERKSSISLVEDDQNDRTLSRKKEQRPSFHRATSSTPSRELPTIPRVRTNGPSDTSPQKDSLRDHWASIRDAAIMSNEKHSKLRKPFPGQSPVSPKKGQDISDQPPPPPVHKSPTSSQVDLSKTPELKSTKSPRSEKHRRRRSSSPLKHEYAPSTASSSPSDSDDFSDSTSDTSDDDLEANDVAGPLPAFNTMKRKSIGVPSSRPTVASTSLAPSESASQAPFRRVPASDQQNTAKTIAMAYYWSDKGSWNPIHADECSIVVTPGLIQAFVMTAAHSGANNSDVRSDMSSDISSSSGHSAKRPLIGLELTPLVPLRRGTALDISIRSPPVEGSQFRSSNNIMLRSRNAEECDVLYGMINQARINNPTYIALQNARPSFQPPVTFNTGPTQGARHSQSSKRSSSWFLGGGGNESKPSYRASSAPGPSIAGGSENSVGTITSAIRRLSGSGMFNISRSAVLKKPGGPGTASLYSSSSGGTGGTGEGSGTSTPVPGIASASMGGINNLKIRLYIREDQSKWRDMGSARLTVLPAVPTGGEPMSPDPSSSGPGQVSSPSLGNSPPPQPSSFQPMQTGNRGPRLPSSTYSPHRIHGDGREKRILITPAKKTTKAGTLLDVCLGESCFERVARTGIAISVWEEHEEGIAKEGGVAGGKAKVFMVQCAGEAEAAWVFGVVGRSRY